MNYRLLPGTSLRVSELGLGTMTWGEQTAEAEAHAQADCAVAHGVNFIDTAEMYPVPPGASTYGRTETILGAWLARQPRDGLIVASKVAGPGRKREWVRGGETALTRKNINWAIDDTLKRLRTDYVDLYQLHWPERNVAMFGTMRYDAAQEKPATPRRWTSSCAPARCATTGCRTRRRGACASSRASQSSTGCRRRQRSRTPTAW
jgi:aryl-alcohol dehydrogenase-like predicted oxidoreductase